MFFLKPKKKSSELVQIFLNELQKETELNYKEIIHSINLKYPNLFSINNLGLMDLMYARIAIQITNLYETFKKEEFENIHLWIFVYLEGNMGEYAVNQVNEYSNIFLTASKIVKVAGPIAVADAMLKDWISNENSGSNQTEIAEKINFSELINIAKDGIINYKTNWSTLKSKYRIKYDSLY
jgi:hypothetical protein